MFESQIKKTINNNMKYYYLCWNTSNCMLCINSPFNELFDFSVFTTKHELLHSTANELVDKLSKSLRDSIKLLYRSHDIVLDVTSKMSDEDKLNNLARAFAPKLRVIDEYNVTVGLSGLTLYVLDHKSGKMYIPRTNVKSHDIQKVISAEGKTLDDLHSEFKEFIYNSLEELGYDYKSKGS